MPSSAIAMKTVVLLFVSLIFLGHVAAAQTTITIEAQESGNALWTVEKRLPLTTSEITEWENTIKNGQNITKYQAVVKAEMDGFLSSAQNLSNGSNFSNRSMKIENFNISYDTIKTLNGGFGIIRYGFEWKNFSRNDSGTIYIGDVFSGGDILSSDITLIIKIPDGYEVQNVSPNPDKQNGNRLIWDHPVFDKGEPNLVLSRTSIEQSTWPIIVVPVVVLISGALLVLWKRKLLPVYIRRNNTVLTYNGGDKASQIENIANDTARTDNAETAIQTDMTANKDTAGINAVRADSTGINPTPAPDAGTETALGDTGTSTTLADSREIKATLMGNAGISVAETGSPEINAVQTDNIRNETAYAQLPDLMAEILGDEEMIEQYLIKRGGQAFQSEIVKESGLSKSKISIVLAKMKDDGRVLKIRKGKENIIRLAVKK